MWMVVQIVELVFCVFASCCTFMHLYGFVCVSVLHVSVTVTVSRSYCVPLCVCVRVCMYE